MTHVVSQIGTALEKRLPDGVGGVVGARARLRHLGDRPGVGAAAADRGRPGRLRPRRDRACDRPGGRVVVLLLRSRRDRQVAVPEGGVGVVAAAVRLAAARGGRAPRHAQDADTGHQHHSAGDERRLRDRLTSIESWSDVAYSFRGDWQMLWKEIATGFLIASPSSAPSERAACGRPVVGRDQLRRRAGLHLRRPDRAAHPRHLPQVLRLGVHRPDHRADAGDDDRLRTHR